MTPNAAWWPSFVVSAAVVLFMVTSSSGQKTKPGDPSPSVCNNVNDAICASGTLCVRQKDRRACCRGCYNPDTGQQSCTSCLTV
jgi:hypothetical protein